MDKNKKCVSQLLFYEQFRSMFRLEFVPFSFFTENNKDQMNIIDSIAVSILSTWSENILTIG